jgi:hypothetical protein
LQREKFSISKLIRCFLGQVRIQYKYLVPIYVFPETKRIFPKQNYNLLSPSSYTHISVEIYIFPGSVLPILLQDRSWKYINRSQTHECGNWDWGRAIPRKGIQKCYYRCSVPTQFLKYFLDILYIKDEMQRYLCNTQNKVIF